MSWLFGKLCRDVDARRADHPDAFPLGYVVWSLDGAPQHRRLLRSLPAEQLNAILPRSPGIHKVAEHPLHAFNAAWQREFTLDRRCTSCESAIALAAQILRRTTADSIWRDPQALPETLVSIIGHAGAWAAPGLC